MDYPKKIENVLFLLQLLLNKSENQGIGKLVAHGCLLSGESLTLKILNDAQLVFTIPKQFNIEINSNKTVYELRCIISKTTLTSPNEIKLFRNNHNGR